MSYLVAKFLHVIGAAVLLGSDDELEGMAQEIFFARVLIHAADEVANGIEEFIATAGRR